MRKDRIYISGKISGERIQEAKLKFQIAQDNIMCNLKEFKGKEITIINPTKLGLTFKDSWLKCMIISIWYLLECNSIYMLKDWRDSRGAKIEFWIAVVLNYKIILQEND
jgi:hypothetical protein